jgi:hypothetical protein
MKFHPEAGKQAMTEKTRPNIKILSAIVQQPVFHVPVSTRLQGSVLKT